MKNQDNEGINIVKIIQLVANDIEKNGVTAPQLTDGWVCPTYKKKDKREIVNYCPITVLNSEYKIIMTALMNKLATIVPSLINKSQAAFIKGRSILDQIVLVNRMIDHCEIMDQEGAIIALDQEKAYNRIHHDYLWETNPLIQMIKSLYTNTKSVAIINGKISEKYTIRRCQRRLYCRHVTGRSRDVGYHSIEPFALIYPSLMLHCHVILSHVL